MAAQRDILVVAAWAAFGAAVAVTLGNTIIGVAIVAAVAGLLAFLRVRGSAGGSGR